tara:strand:- start:273 stop:1298 length:1026 start_codon:yes stop_codon:yes gene_type:complete
MTNNNSQSSVSCVGNGGVILHNQGNARFNTDNDGAVVTEKRLAINRNAGDPYVDFQTSGTSNIALYGGASSGFRVFTKPSGGSLTERVRITNDGKVGIGDDNPDYILHLKSNVPAICFEDTDGTHGQCIIEQNSDNLKIRCDAGNASSGTGSNIRFEVDGTEKVRIKSDGSLIAKGVRGVTVHNVSTADVEIGGRHIWNRIESTNHATTSGAQQFKIKFFRSSSSNSVTCYYKGVVVNVTASGRYDWGGHGYVTHSSSTILMFSSTTGGSHRHVHNEGYNHINNTANGVNHKISGVAYSYDSNYLYATFSFDTNISGTGFKPYYNIEIIDPSQCTYDVEGI